MRKLHWNNGDATMEEPNGSKWLVGKYKINHKQWLMDWCMENDVVFMDD